jgi:hypothetical protein
LSDSDIVTTQLEPISSLIATTGIVFQDLERCNPIPVRQWTDVSNALRTARPKRGQ